MWRHLLSQAKETYNLRARYGITAEDKKEKIQSQGNVCAICKQTFKNKLDTHMDHCHTTNVLRGVLCGKCNLGLGKFNDSPQLLRYAAIYLEYHAKQNQPSSISTGNHQESQDIASYGSIHGTRTREDCDGAHHHIGEPEGYDADSSTQTSGGVSMGSGVSEMETFGTSESSKDHGLAKEQTECIRKFVEHICSESRELGMAIRAEQKVRLPHYRRIKSFQRFLDKKVQGTQEAPKIVQAEVDTNWNSEPTGTTRPVEPSRHIRLRTTFRDEFDPIPGQVYGSWSKE